MERLKNYLLKFTGEHIDKSLNIIKKYETEELKNLVTKIPSFKITVDTVLLVLDHFQIDNSKFSDTQLEELASIFEDIRLNKDIV